MTTLAFDLYIRATPEQVWQALTDPELVPRWRFGMSFDTDWRTGSPLTSRAPDGSGTVTQCLPGRRLAYDWIQTDQPESNGGHSSTVMYELGAMGEVTQLSVVHSNLDEEGLFLKVVRPGWPMLLSSLKTLLETGEPLPFRTSA
ncbi:SRPBCC domain-containing protein [Streptomyces sp. NPDC051776]|uniref:SRPBCC domain-containing protein n=1 Tax=Streptomyces sp. NPDC051776 TaxID=3155414 RepID=UPI003444245A